MGRKRLARGTCEACGRQLENLRRLYCNPACHQEADYQRYIRCWLAGELNGGRAQGRVSNYIRRWLFERAGGKCEECGWSRVHPVTGLIPLAVHHIDGNAKNNRPENLRLLCGGCHMLTPTFGKLNAGRGREDRWQPRLVVAVAGM